MILTILIDLFWWIQYGVEPTLFNVAMANFWLAVFLIGWALRGLRK